MMNKFIDAIRGLVRPKQPGTSPQPSTTAPTRKARMFMFGLGEVGKSTIIKQLQVCAHLRRTPHAARGVEFVQK